jgi:hypothetical protein
LFSSYGSGIAEKLTKEEKAHKMVRTEQKINRTNNNPHKGDMWKTVFRTAQFWHNII